MKHSFIEETLQELRNKFSYLNYPIDVDTFISQKLEECMKMKEEECKTKIMKIIDLGISLQKEKV